MAEEVTTSRLLISLSLALVMGGCGDGVPDSTMVVDSAGVRIATYRGVARLLPWSLDTILLLGGEADGPEGFYKARLPLVDTDSSGRIYVLNDVSREVTVFDSAGANLGVFGREGDGPGEFRFPVSVSAADAGVFYVLDGDKRAIGGIGLDGQVRPPIDYPFSVINIGFPHFQLGHTGLGLWARDPFVGADGAKDRRDRLWWISDRDTVELVPSMPSPVTSAAYPECRMQFSIPVPLAPFPRWSQWGDRVVVNVWPEYRLDVFDAGGLTMSIRQQEEPDPLTEDQAVALLEARGFRGGPCNSDAREVIRKHGFNPRPQVVRNVALESSGSIWVQYEGSDGGRRIDIYLGGGDYVGSLREGFPMPLGFLPDGRLLIQVKDAFDVERLGIARLLGSGGER
jgi:hypothetical protein